MKPVVRVERPSLAALRPSAGFGTLACVAAALEDESVRVPSNGMMLVWTARPPIWAETGKHSTHHANLVRLRTRTALEFAFNGDVLEERSDRLAADVCADQRLPHGQRPRSVWSWLRWRFQNPSPGEIRAILRGQ